MPEPSIVRRRFMIQLCCRIFAGIALACALDPLHARTLAVHADRLHSPEADARDIELRVRESSAATLDLDIGRLDAPALGIADRLTWRCAIANSTDGTRSCAGPVQLASSSGPAATLEARLLRDRVELDLSSGNALVRLQLPIAGGVATRIELARVPVAWLRGALDRAWAGAELREGTIDGDATLGAGDAITGHYAFDALTFNTADGALATEEATANGDFALDALSSAPHVRAGATFAGGRLRFGDVRIDLPSTPVALDVEVAADGNAWKIDRLSWRDPDVLAFTASATIDASGQHALHRLDVRIGHAAFPAAFDRYAHSLFVARGWPAIRAKGALSGEFAIDGAPRRVTLSFDHFGASDGKDFSIRGLDGVFDWSADGERPPQTLRWKSIKAGAAALGAGQALLRSREGVIALARSFATPFSGGTLALKKLSFDPRIERGLAAEASYAIRKIGYESADGTIAAAGIDANGDMTLGGTLEAPALSLTAMFHGGEALYGSFYVKLPASPVRASAVVRREGDRWRVASFEWNDPGVLEVDGRAEIALAAPKPVASLTLDLRRADLATAIGRYAKSWLGANGYAELSASGTLAGVLAYGADGLQRLTVDASGVDVDDGAGRFRFVGLDGGIDWRHDEPAPPTSLAWKSIELFRIPLDAARAELQSENAAITLAKPLAVGVLGGEWRIERMRLEPRSPRGERYAASFALAGIDMQRLCKALGWPSFGGSLSGGIPEIVLAGDRIELHGGLDLYLFEGYLGVSGVTLERPFGVAPSLDADIHFENFDLDELTQAFDFGGMSGKLDGNVANLRLVDWSPVAFDASLRSDKGGRMSYKAVNDLTALGGGGGLSANLQTMALKLFDTFGYRRLGIRCKLVAEVCTMGGIEPDTDSAGDSYTIVEGSGLPRIEIVGHRRRVAWPTLVERLIEATRGNGPVIE
jgi:hypothetical protein